MFKCINGWTKEKMKEQIKKYNNGTQSAVQNHNGTSCLYLNPKDNNRCAVGCFIPPNSGKAFNFQGSVTSLLENFESLDNFMPLEIEALELLQNAHDRTENVKTTNMHQILFNWIDNNVQD